MCIENQFTTILLLCTDHCTTQTSSDGNQTTSTLSITLNRSDAGRYLSCRAYNHAVPSDALEDGWRLDIQCECLQSNIIPFTKARTWHDIVTNAAFSTVGLGIHNIYVYTYVKCFEFDWNTVIIRCGSFINWWYVDCTRCIYLPHCWSILASELCLRWWCGRDCAFG